jgi:hypothetical protein
MDAIPQTVKNTHTLEALLETSLDILVKMTDDEITKYLSSALAACAPVTNIPASLVPVLEQKTRKLTPSSRLGQEIVRGGIKKPVNKLETIAMAQAMALAEMANLDAQIAKKNSV